MDLNPSSGEEDLEEEPAAPDSYPPHDHVIDGDGQQWAYYTTRTPDERLSTIAGWFDANVEEVVQSNAPRYPELKGSSLLREGTG